ncbi:hypothetical protein J6590_073295 [Homalodisca vitripennis]|nr:hypothetical protein J6590_073295 [Homalodisca vitripennis]
MDLDRRPLLPNLTHLEYPATPEVAQRCILRNVQGFTVFSVINPMLFPKLYRPLHAPLTVRCDSPQLTVVLVYFQNSFYYSTIVRVQLLKDHDSGCPLAAAVTTQLSRHPQRQQSLYDVFRNNRNKHHKDCPFISRVPEQTSGREMGTAGDRSYWCGPQLASITEEEGMDDGRCHHNHRQPLISKSMAVPRIALGWKDEGWQKQKHCTNRDGQNRACETRVHESDYLVQKTLCEVIGKLSNDQPLAPLKETEGKLELASYAKLTCRVANISKGHRLKRKVKDHRARWFIEVLRQSRELVAYHADLLPSRDVFSSSPYSPVRDTRDSGSPASMCLQFTVICYRYRTTECFSARLMARGRNYI